MNLASKIAQQYDTRAPELFRDKAIREGALNLLWTSMEIDANGFLAWKPGTTKETIKTFAFLDVNHFAIRRPEVPAPFASEAEQIAFADRQATYLERSRPFAPAEQSREALNQPGDAGKLARAAQAEREIMLRMDIDPGSLDPNR